VNERDPPFNNPRLDTTQEQILAGQPQEPSWQSAAQDQTRQDWRTYPPPSADNADRQDSYGYPQPAGGQGYGQGYPQQAGYPGPSYTVQDQAFSGQDQGYAGSQGQAAPHWQAVAGMSQAPTKGKAKGGTTKGFLGALFDFSFTSFVTPKIVKVLYVLITIWTVIWALVFLRLGFRYGGAAGGFFTLVVVDPILVVLTLGVYRMVLELFMVVHRMHDDLKALRDRAED
jgi:uncharacterized membrane protein